LSLSKIVTFRLLGKTPCKYDREQKKSAFLGGSKRSGLRAKIRENVFKKSVTIVKKVSFFFRLFFHTAIEKGAGRILKKLQKVFKCPLNI